jgi:hypothetical protein
MPYKLRKAPRRDLYWVVDDTGKHYSKDPLPKQRAREQQKALYASENRELRGGFDVNDLVGVEKTAIQGINYIAPGLGTLINTVGDAVLPLFTPKPTAEEIAGQQREAARQQVNVNVDALQQVAQQGSPKAQKLMSYINSPAYSGLGKHLRGGYDPRGRLAENVRRGMEIVNMLDVAQQHGAPQAFIQELQNDLVALHQEHMRLENEVFDAEEKERLNNPPSEPPVSGEGLSGGGPAPSLNILQQMADASYKDLPRSEIDNFELVRATPTLKFYKSRGDNTIVVAVRGTRINDPQDIKADVALPLGLLETTQRYLNDLRTLQLFQQQFHPAMYDYYGVGHSLGGAIIDLFLQNHLLHNAVSYNPAIQPKNLAQAHTLPNKRIYNEHDPLYQLFGKQIQGVEVRKPKDSFIKGLIKKIPYIGKFYKAYDAHQLRSFQGGAKGVESQLSGLKINADLYLKEAKKKASKAGLNADSLAFSKGEHKLEITDPRSGSVVRFGRRGYGDHIIWSALERRGEVEKGHAAQKRRVFRKSHSAIKGDWKKNPYSPNNLAIQILW